LQFWTSGFKRRLGKGPRESDNNIHGANWFPYLEQMDSMNLQSGREARERRSFGRFCKIPNSLENTDLGSLALPVRKIEGIEGNLKLAGSAKTLLHPGWLQWNSVPWECLVARNLCVFRKNSLINRCHAIK